MQDIKGLDKPDIHWSDDLTSSVEVVAIKALRKPFGKPSEYQFATDDIMVYDGRASKCHPSREQ